ncbi:MAG: amidohydrolase, partial [Gammaproteobacteria bacterium]
MDGRDLEQISSRDDNPVFVSPTWSADGASIFVSEYHADLNAFDLWKFDARPGGSASVVVPINTSTADNPDNRTSTAGAVASMDGRFLYYASHTGAIKLGTTPEWTVKRRDLASGEEETVVFANHGPRPDLNSATAFRPAVSPDGKTVVYGTHYDGATGLRLLNLETREDRWLAFPVQQDQLEASSWSDILPGYGFTPDGRALILSRDGKIQRLELASGTRTSIPFAVHVSLDVGPSLRASIAQESGPVRARIIQTPEQSPDGRRLILSALAHLWIMDLNGSGRPRRLVSDEQPAFMPSWSPDGRSVVYVTWTAQQGGEIWLASVDGSGVPRQLSEFPAFYTSPVFTPDGQSIVAVRSSTYVRMHAYMEYGLRRSAELIKLPVGGGAALVIARGNIGGKPHFSADSKQVYLDFDDGLNAVALDGSGHRQVLPLAQIAQQLHLVGVPQGGDRTVDLSHPGVPRRKLTEVGADFFAWADGGRTITWAVGSTFYRQSMPDIGLDQPASAVHPASAAKRGRRAMQTFEAVVELPRDTPRGALVLRGATAITMRGDEVIDDADVLIVDDHIAAVGPRGRVRLPPGAAIHDVSGRYILPGFIDVHDHLADVRRSVLDLRTWGPLANLAYGVTMVLDPSPLSIDMLTYEDLIDTGQMLGSRIHSTGPAIFSFNDFKSYGEVLSVLSRYSRHYRTRNLEEYRTGNRRVRQWVAMASKELGLLPTTEGALAMKLDLSQIMDGFAGNEHALVAYPLSRDVVQLVAQTRVSYTMTLGITNGGPEGQDYYIALNHPHDDPKLNRFSPHYVVDIKTLAREWHDPRENLFPRIAEGGAKIARAGGLLGVGSHGEMPGLGYHWEMQAYAAGG